MPYAQPCTSVSFYTDEAAYLAAVSGLGATLTEDFEGINGDLNAGWGPCMSGNVFPSPCLDDFSTSGRGTANEQVQTSSLGMYLGAGPMAGLTWGVGSPGIAPAKRGFKFEGFAPSASGGGALGFAAFSVAGASMVGDSTSITLEYTHGDGMGGQQAGAQIISVALAAYTTTFMGFVCEGGEFADASVYLQDAEPTVDGFTLDEVSLILPAT